MRANGSVEGGAGAFKAGESVYVLKKNVSSPSLDEVKVIGRVDGVKRCKKIHIEILIYAQKKFYPHTAYPVAYAFVREAGAEHLFFDGVLTTDPEYMQWRENMEYADAEPSMYHAAAHQASTADWLPESGTDTSTPAEEPPQPAWPCWDVFGERTFTNCAGGSAFYFAYNQNDHAGVYPFSAYSNLHPYSGYAFFRTSYAYSIPKVVYRWFCQGDSGTSVVSSYDTEKTMNTYTPFGIIASFYTAYNTSYSMFSGEHPDDHMECTGYMNNAGYSFENVMVNVFWSYGFLMTTGAGGETDYWDEGCQVQIAFDQTVEDIRSKDWLSYPPDASLAAKIKAKMRSVLAENGISGVYVGAVELHVSPAILQ